MATTSSFKRAGAPARPAPPPGTHLSIHNGQLLTSSGLSDFDNILSGGLVLGTVTLVEEDLNTRHNQSLCKYLLAEGAACGHALMVVSASANPRDILRTLPAVISEEEHKTIIQTEQQPEDSNALKIAWRYKDSPQQGKDSGAKKSISHSFDQSRPIATELLLPNKIEVVQLAFMESSSSSDIFKSIFEAVSKAISKHNCDSSTESKEPRNVIRILLQSFGSPQWSANIAQQLQFLHALRGLLRTSFAVCYVTIPSHLYSMQNIRQVQHLCDAAVRLQSFQASFNKYNGLLHVVRLPRLNSLVPPLQDATVYGFIAKRRRFYIEQLHIPPADESSTSDSAASASASSMLCVPTKASKLEF